MPIYAQAIEPKLMRSRDHLAWLQEQIKDWTTDRSELVFLEDDHYVAVGWVLRVKTPMDLQVGVVFGEVAHALRSVLDNMAWQIHITQGGEPKTPAAASIAFPSEHDESKWPARVKRHLPHATPEQLEVFARYQPFAGHPGSETIGLLKDLDNADKHDTLQPIGAAEAKFTYRAPTIPVDDMVVSMRFPHGALPLYEIGDHPVCTVLVQHADDDKLILLRASDLGRAVDLGRPEVPDLKYGVVGTRGMVSFGKLVEMHQLVIDIAAELADLNGQAAANVASAPAGK